MNSKPRGPELFLKTSAFPQQTELCFYFWPLPHSATTREEPFTCPLFCGLGRYALFPGQMEILKFSLESFRADDDGRKLRKDSAIHCDEI